MIECVIISILLVCLIYVWSTKIICWTTFYHTSPYSHPTEQFLWIFSNFTKESSFHHISILDRWPSFARPGHLKPVPVNSFIEIWSHLFQKYADRQLLHVFLGNVKRAWPDNQVFSTQRSIRDYPWIQKEKKNQVIEGAKRTHSIHLALNLRLTTEENCLPCFSLSKLIAGNYKFGQSATNLPTLKLANLSKIMHFMTPHFCRKAGGIFKAALTSLVPLISR